MKPITRRHFLLACAFAAAGCRRAGNAPELELREWRTWFLPAHGASLPTPRSLAVTANNELIVLDTGGRVVVFNPEGQVARQWHMLDSSVGMPEGLVALKDGHIVVCDTHYHRLVWFDPEGRWGRNVGQKGEGRAEFIYPVAITTDAQENIYVCEYGGHDRVQVFSRDGQWLREFGSFGTGEGQFQRPSGIAWRDHLLYIADAINNRVLIFKDTGEYVGRLGANPDGKGDHLALHLPYDIALGPDDQLYIIEYGSGRLTRVAPDGWLTGRFGRTGSGRGEFATPWGLTVDSTGRIYVADTKNRRLISLRLG